MNIAILPIGYYEGYDRRLSNKGIVYLPKYNTTANVIGRICMNVTMIDVSHIPNAQKNDTVILLGNHPGVRTDDVATIIESFNPREITTRLNPLISRVITL